MRPFLGALGPQQSIAHAGILLGFSFAISACAQILGGDGDYTLTSSGSGGSTQNTGSGASAGTSTSSSNVAGSGGVGGGTTSNTVTGGGGTTTTNTTTPTEPCDGADLQTSPSHCGACDHNCQGGDCVVGQCQPIVLTENLQSVRDMAMDATHLYWLTSDDGHVERIEKNGGLRELLASNQQNGRRIATSDANIYWTLPSGKNLKFTSKTPGSQVMQIPGNVPDTTGITIAAGKMFVTHGISGNGAVAQWTLPNANKKDLLANLQYPTEIVATPEFAFFIDDVAGANNDVLIKLPVDAGAETTLSQGFHKVTDLAVDTDFVYVAEDGGRLLRISALGDQLELSKSTDRVTSLAVDSRHVYWTTTATDGTQNGAVLRCNKDGTEPITLAENLISPTSLLSDENTLYWVELGPFSGGTYPQGKIRRLAK